MWGDAGGGIRGGGIRGGASNTSGSRLSCLIHEGVLACTDKPVERQSVSRPPPKGGDGGEGAERVGGWYGWRSDSPSGRPFSQQQGLGLAGQGSREGRDGQET